MLLFLKSIAAAFAVFIGLACALGTFWAILLGPVMEDVWDRLPGAGAEWLGGGLLSFAVLSGLALHFFVLARVVRSLGAAGAETRRLLLTAGILPPILALAGIYALIANMRLGW